MTFISEQLNRVVAVLVNRSGEIESVMIGDDKRVYLPDIGRQRGGQSRFRGIRLIRTNLKGSEDDVELTEDDLADLSKLQLDMVITVAVGAGGYPGQTAWAHLLPENPEGKMWEINHTDAPDMIALNFDYFIEELESEFQRKSDELIETEGEDPALLVYIATPDGRNKDVELEELQRLCDTAGVQVMDTIVQSRPEMHPKYGVGRGKIEEITLRALQLDCELVIFGQDLSPGQLHAITDETDRKVIDRTQLILDIFAQRAKSKDGKLQVELAQLKYSMPRLHQKNTGMSRLQGGIGGRGPGETKLEINRRRAQEKMRKLEDEIDELSKQREVQRKRRKNSNIPIVSIVGYTNAGKSTLLNGLTDSEVFREDKLFATLRPTTRRLRYPQPREILLTDTVGFLHQLPEDLVNAFRATLEELKEADLLIHLVDVSEPNFDDRMESVQSLLSHMDVSDKEQLLVFNKVDKIPDEKARALAETYDAIPISALHLQTTRPLVEELENRLLRHKQKDQHYFSEQ
jgi:GTP-binding protein HflX